jgi:hypothetical protein
MAEPGSSFRHLLDGVLAEFPETHATFFVPVDRLPDVAPALHPATFLPIDRRPEFARFVRELDADPRFECAFHGTLHGLPGPTAAAYVPEFELHAELQALLGALREGARIWKDVFGAPPAGGKYPAYARGVHGDGAIEIAGFTWWCRRWDRGLGEPADPVAFQPRWFGERGVVDVPSTFHGGFLTLPPLSAVRPGGVPMVVLTRVRGRAWLDAQIDALLAHRAPITIQEHITSSRADGGRQTPNVYDDVRTLRAIFGRLRRERVWHATCGEIARYFRTRERSRVRAIDEREFVVECDGEPAAPLSLVVSGAALPDVFLLRGPTGSQAVRVASRNGALGCVLAPVALPAGRYRLPA